ncbi:MAG TPA: hypothetical protein DCL54_08650, partial [Alphaproteobacteria bacterium]|nr:hypothetical protein [Alphaproteobacteria bacterium]
IEDDRRSPHSLYGKLFVAIWIHNVNVQRACEAKMVSRPVCRTARFRPRWLAEPGTKMYSFRALTGMAEQAQRAMTPFWTELCSAAAKQKKQDLASYCPME